MQFYKTLLSIKVDGNKFNTELLAEKNPPCTKNEVVNGQLI